MLKLKRLNILLLFGLISCSSEEKLVPNTNAQEINYRLRISKQNTSELSSIETGRMHISDRLVLYKGEDFFASMSREELDDYKYPELQEVKVDTQCEIKAKLYNHSASFSAATFYAVDILPVKALVNIYDEVYCRSVIRPKFASGSTNSVEIKYILDSLPLSREEAIFNLVDLKQFAPVGSERIFCQDRNEKILSDTELNHGNEFLCRLIGENGNSKLYVNNNYRPFQISYSWNHLPHANFSESTLAGFKVSSYASLILTIRNDFPYTLLLQLPTDWGRLTYQYYPSDERFRNATNHGHVNSRTSLPNKILNSNPRPITTSDYNTYRLHANEVLEVRIGNPCEFLHMPTDNVRPLNALYELNDLKIFYQLEKYSEYQYIFSSTMVNEIRSAFEQSNAINSFDFSRAYMTEVRDANCQSVR